jgi:hypothetical protein
MTNRPDYISDHTEQTLRDIFARHGDDSGTNPTADYNQDATQSERRAILANDLTANDLAAAAPQSATPTTSPQGSRWIGGSPLASTYYAEANLIDPEDEVLRRRAELAETRTGSGAAVYGRNLPASSWSNDPVPTEPPTGYRIDDLTEDQLGQNPNIGQSAAPDASDTTFPETLSSSGAEQGSPSPALGDDGERASPTSLAISPPLRRRI